MSHNTAYDRTNHISLQDRLQAGRGGHGRGVPRRGRQARPHGGAQVLASRHGAGARHQGALHPGGQGRLGAQAPQRLHHPRHPGARGPDVHRDGARRGRHAGGQEGPALYKEGRGRGGPGGRRAGRRAREGDRAPRH